MRYQTGDVSRQLDRQGWNSEERPEQAINVGMVTSRCKGIPMAGWLSVGSRCQKGCSQRKGDVSKREEPAWSGSNWSKMLIYHQKNRKNIGNYTMEKLSSHPLNQVFKADTISNRMNQNHLPPDRMWREAHRGSSSVIFLERYLTWI